MRFDIELAEVKTGFKIWMPVADHVRNVFKTTNTVIENVEFPFWTRIWPAAFVLTDFLQEESQWVKNKSVLELGAGIGLPSFSIANLVKKILISDSIDEAVQLIAINIETLQLQNAKSVKFDWRQPANSIPVDTLIMSDICYDPSQFKLIVDLLHVYKLQGTDIIITAPHRLSTIPFLDLVKPLVKRTVIKSHDGIENIIIIL